MTTWGDHDRVEKIKKIIRDIRHDLGIIERLLRHMGSQVPDVTRSRPLGPLDEAVGPGWHPLNRGVSGEGDE